MATYDAPPTPIYGAGEEDTASHLFSTVFDVRDFSAPSSMESPET